VKGTVVASTDPSDRLSAQFNGLTLANSLTVETLGPIKSGTDGLDWIMTAPIVGYDSTLPPDTGLYRMLMALGTRRARQRKMLYNMSAGAASSRDACR
jgi:hypothetical protein